MKIAITGGTGFVGSALIDLAFAEGHEVVALTRKEQEPREGVTWVRGDLSDGKALGQIAGDAEAAIHVAGAVNAPDAEGFEEANVAGTLNFVEACIAAGLPRFVLVSSLSAREPDLSLYGGSKARAETVVKASGLDWTIVRPPAIFGPRDTEMFELFKAARRGFVPMPKEGRASIIHVEDLARLLLALLPGGEGVTGETFEPDDGRLRGWSHYELARAIGWAVGRRPKVLKISRRTMERVARIDGFLRRGKAKLTLDRAAYFSHPDWVVSADAHPPQDLWQPKIETRAGLKTTAHWYRDQGWF